MQEKSATLDVSFGGSWEVARCSGPKALDGPTLVQALEHTVGFGHLCSLPSLPLAHLAGSFDSAPASLSQLDCHT